MEEEKKEETKNKDIVKELCPKIEDLIINIKEDGINSDNLEYLYKLVDIHKDLKNEKYWESEERKMRYSNYGNEYDDYNSYGRRGVPGTGRGRYREGSYGRQGVDAKYRGEDMLDEMSYHYGNYHDSNSYGAKEDSAYKMTEAFKEFGYSIAEELEPNEKKMFKKAMQEIMQELDK